VTRVVIRADQLGDLSHKPDNSLLLHFTRSTVTSSAQTILTLLNYVVRLQRCVCE